MPGLARLPAPPSRARMTAGGIRALGTDHSCRYREGRSRP